MFNKKCIFIIINEEMRGTGGVALVVELALSLKSHYHQKNPKKE
jgi:hypothetical protein